MWGVGRIRADALGVTGIRSPAQSEADMKDVPDTPAALATRVFL
jgi:hypothetical protein